MDSSLRLRLAAHLRRLRGEDTLEQFARRIGVAVSSLHRLEAGQQNVGIDMLQTIAERLGCDVGDLFPPA